MGIFGPTDLLFSYTAGGSLNDATFSRASKATYRDRTGTLSTASSTGVTRLQWYDVDGDGGWEQPALLLEGSRTNVWASSELLSNDPPWTQGSVTVTADQTAAPDGSTSADLMRETASTGVEHGISRSGGISWTAGNRQSVSIFAKAKERNWLFIETNDGVTNTERTWFNVLTGEIGTQSTAHAAVIESYRDGWYRCMVTFPVPSSSTATTDSQQFRIASSDGSITHDGSTANGIYIWGAQFEEDSPYPTSYIPTSTASVTRSADSLKYPLRFGPQDFTIYAKVKRPPFADSTDIGSNPGIVQLSTTNPIIELRFGSGGTQSIIRSTTTNVNVISSMPSADPSEVLSQYRNFSTGPQTRVDSGGGLSTWSGKLAALPALGSTNLKLGDDPFGGIELDTGLIEIKISKGLKTLAQMRDLRADR